MRFFDFAIRFMAWLKENEEMQPVHLSFLKPFTSELRVFFFSDLSDRDFDIRLHAFTLNVWLELELTRQKQFKNTEHLEAYVHPRLFFSARHCVRCSAHFLQQPHKKQLLTLFVPRGNSL